MRPPPSYIYARSHPLLRVDVFVRRQPAELGDRATHAPAGTESAEQMLAHDLLRDPEVGRDLGLRLTQEEVALDDVPLAVREARGNDDAEQLDRALLLLLLQRIWRGAAVGRGQAVEDLRVDRDLQNSGFLLDIPLVPVATPTCGGALLPRTARAVGRSAPRGSRTCRARHRPAVSRHCRDRCRARSSGTDRTRCAAA